MTQPHDYEQVHAAQECQCDGSGKLQYESVDRDAQGREIGHTLGSHPCPCRQALEPREGQAAWWSSETVERRVVTACTGLYTAVIDVETEVPYSEGNYKVVRRGNRYYPTMIAIDFEGGSCFMPEDCRDLARALLAAADQAETIDDADSKPCGHWSGCPCDCENAS